MCLTCSNRWTHSVCASTSGITKESVKVVELFYFTELFDEGDIRA